MSPTVQVLKSVYPIVSLSIRDKSLLRVFQCCRAAGFQMVAICANGEVIPILDPMKCEQEFEPNCASAQEHVPDAERNNRVIKERVRVTIHSSPFDALPRAMLKFVVSESATKLTFFPVKHGCSECFSPRQMIHQVPLDYQTQCTIPALSCGLAEHQPNPTNIPESRGIDSIHLRPLSNAQGGHQVHDLHAKQVIARSRFKKLPMSQSITNKVNAHACSDGMTSSKITSGTDKVLCNSCWIVEVDHEELAGEESSDESQRPPVKRPKTNKRLMTTKMMMKVQSNRTCQNWIKKTMKLPLQEWMKKRKRVTTLRPEMKKERL